MAVVSSPAIGKLSNARCLLANARPSHVEIVSIYSFKAPTTCGPQHFNKWLNRPNTGTARTPTSSCPNSGTARTPTSSWFSNLSTSTTSATSQSVGNLSNLSTSQSVGNLRTSQSVGNLSTSQSVGNLRTSATSAPPRLRIFSGCAHGPLHDPQRQPLDRHGCTSTAVTLHWRSVDRCPRVTTRFT